MVLVDDTTGHVSGHAFSHQGGEEGYHDEGEYHQAESVNWIPPHIPAFPDGYLIDLLEYVHGKSLRLRNMMNQVPT